MTALDFHFKKSKTIQKPTSKIVSNEFSEFGGSSSSSLVQSFSSDSDPSRLVKALPVVESSSPTRFNLANDPTFGLTNHPSALSLHKKQFLKEASGSASNSQRDSVQNDTSRNRIEGDIRIDGSNPNTSFQKLMAPNKQRNDKKVHLAPPQNKG